MNKTRVMPAIVAATLLLAGCGGPKKDATYDTVAELKDAAVAAGYECPDWEQSNRVKKASQSGTCSTADVFSIYLTAEDAQATVDAMKNLPGSEVHVLVGPNWVINAPSDTLENLRDQLGGQIVEYSGGKQSGPPQLTSFTLRESCDQMPTLHSTIGSDALGQLALVKAVAEAGDTTTRQTLQPVIDALVAASTAPDGLPAIEADQAFLDELSVLADACAAAGSNRFS